MIRENFIIRKITLIQNELANLSEIDILQVVNTTDIL